MTVSKLAKRIDPKRLGYSPKMAALVGAVIGFDYGVRDGKGGKLGHLSITSDGFIIAASTAHESGAFIGTLADFERNLKSLIQDANLTDSEKMMFAKLYKSNVTDHRI